MRTYKFKLYQSKKNRQLKRTINVAAVIWNHCIALHKRYYRMYGKHLHKYKLTKHLAKRRKRIDWWQQVGSQAVQDIVFRIDKSYQLFFKHHKKGVRPPTFQKVKKYKSFTLTQAGYRFLEGNRLKIGKKVYKYSNSREIEGTIKTLTVKRDPSGDLFITVVTDQKTTNLIPVSGKTAGFDFGLKTFLSLDDGKKIESPLFFKQGHNEIKRLNRSLSAKKIGSNNWHKARVALAKGHRRIADQRKDWFWKLAHKLTDEYDYLFFEDLNLNGMKKLWGRKVSDLSFGTFLEILKTVAESKGKTVHHVDRWYPSSKTCSHCGHKLKSLDLNVRRWRCPHCKSENDRDCNAAINIKREGASSLGLDTVRLKDHIDRLASVA